MSNLKIQIASAILIDNSFQLSVNNDFLSLIDRNKVKDVSLVIFNKIIYNDCFTDAERAYIREERRKCVNRRAANVSRRRRKQEDTITEIEMQQMEVAKNDLLKEKCNLVKEIEQFKRLTEQDLQTDTLFDDIYDLSLFNSIFESTDY